jgi:hypothetical protein
LSLKTFRLIDWSLEVALISSTARVAPFSRPCVIGADAPLLEIINAISEVASALSEKKRKTEVVNILITKNKFTFSGIVLTGVRIIGL